MSIDERIADRISVLCSAKSSNAHEYDLCVRAVRAALADPVLRGEIENAAYERAAEACERLISGDGICAADGVWIHDCADAIRALIKEKK